MLAPLHDVVLGVAGPRRVNLQGSNLYEILNDKRSISENTEEIPYRTHSF